MNHKIWLLVLCGTIATNSHATTQKKQVTQHVLQFLAHSREETSKSPKAWLDELQARPHDHVLYTSFSLHEGKDNFTQAFYTLEPAPGTDTVSLRVHVLQGKRVVIEDPSALDFLRALDFRKKIQEQSESESGTLKTTDHISGFWQAPTDNIFVMDYTCTVVTPRKALLKAMQEYATS